MNEQMRMAVYDYHSQSFKENNFTFEKLMLKVWKVPLRIISEICPEFTSAHTYCSALPVLVLSDPPFGSLPVFALFLLILAPSHNLTSFWCMSSNHALSKFALSSFWAWPARLAHYLPTIHQGMGIGYFTWSVRLKTNRISIDIFKCSLSLPE